MKKLLTLITLLPSLLFAQDYDNEMKIWQEYMTPGKMHEKLAGYTGDWTYVQETWLEPGAEVMIDKGKAICGMIFGGRYLQINLEGTGFGMEYKGVTIIGYDNGKNVFQSFWIDNFGTGMSTADGKWDETSKSIITEGGMFDPVSKKVNNYKIIIKDISPDSFSNEMFAYTPEGKEFMMARTIYSRVK